MSGVWPIWKTKELCYAIDPKNSGGKTMVMKNYYLKRKLLHFPTNAVSFRNSAFHSEFSLSGGNR